MWRHEEQVHLNCVITTYGGMDLFGHKSAFWKQYNTKVSENSEIRRSNQTCSSLFSTEDRSDSSTELIRALGIQCENYSIMKGDLFS